MAHPDRTRLQVFIPTATATALGIAAESLGLSKTQTVETILGQYLTRQGMLTTNTAAWPKPKPPASVQRPITLPTRLVEWLRSQPGNISDATRSAIASGIRIEQEGGNGVPSAEKMDATSKPGQRTNPGEDGGRHQSPPSTKRSQLERSGTHLHPRRLRRGRTTPPKAPRSPRGQLAPLGRGPNSGMSAAPVRDTAILR